MALPMRTSGAGVELIKSFEGFRARATELPNGKWMIGYGHTDGARAGLRVTREEAELVLRHHDLKPIETLIGERVLTPLTQNEFDALVSFAFNIGPDAFLDSNVLSLLNSGERLQAAEGMTAWRKGRVDGETRIVDALVRRRAAEKALFLEHPSGRIPVPGALMRPRFDQGAVAAMPRERPVVVEARTEGNRMSAARPAPRTEAVPEAAARAVAERLSKLLDEENDAAGPADAPLPGVPTADEITRAVSALAEPDGPGEDGPPDNVIEARPHRLAPPPEPTVPARDAPSGQPPARLQHPPAAPEDQALNVMRWLPYALLAGLSFWGIVEGVRRAAAPPVPRLPEGSDQAFVGPLLAFGSAMLCVLSVYYLYRALRRQD